MKILLIKPPEKEVYTKVPTIAGVAQPMGLACIAAYIRENGFTNVKILDCEAEQIGIDEIGKYIPVDVDVVGLGSVTPTLKNTGIIMRVVKGINPKCVTVLGGDHISALPEETMKEFSQLDFGIVGEGEITFLELLQTLQKNKNLSKVYGLVYRGKKNEIRLNPPRPLMPNLDVLPIPAYDLLKMDKYMPPAHHASFHGKGIKLSPFTIFFSLRGCPYNCRYCASKVMWEKRVRYRSVEKTFEEIDYLIENYGIKCLEFNDENFIINKPRMRKLLEGLKERKEKYGMYWNCLTRVDSVDEQTLRDMKEAGCYFIRFGVESGNQKILDAMDKGITVAQIRNAFELVNKVGIASSASFIIGYPGETKETFAETFKLVKEIKPTLAFFFVAIPIVGTHLYYEAKEKNLILNLDWNGWVQMAETPIMRTETLSPDDLLEMRRKAYKEFYFRPSYIFKMVSGIRTKEQLKFYVNGVLGALNLIKQN